MWSETPTPAKCAPPTVPTTFVPFSWLHKELLLPPSNGVERLSHGPYLPWPPKLFEWGAKLQLALPEPPPHKSHHPHSGPHSTRRVFPLPVDHCQQGTVAWPGGLMAGRFMPCSHSAQHAAFPRTLPLPPAGEVAFFFALSYPKCFLKAPGNASKRFYSLSV